MPSDPYLDLVRLQEEQQTELLDRLDQAAPSEETEQWSAYRASGIPLTLTHPGGDESRFAVLGWRLNPSGLEIVHGGYLHEASECTVQLSNTSGGVHVLNARVGRCTLIGNRLHYVRLDFFKKIDVLDFLRPSDEDREERTVGRDPEGLAKKADLSGHVLVVSADETTRDELGTALKSMGLCVESAHILGAALDCLRRSRFQCVVVDMDFQEFTPEHILESVRRVEGSAPIVATGYEVDDSIAATDKHCMALPKPAESDRLYEVMSSALGRQPAAEGC